jgi:hypothetical protein
VCARARSRRAASKNFGRILFKHDLSLCFVLCNANKICIHVRVYQFHKTVSPCGSILKEEEGLLYLGQGF